MSGLLNGVTITSEWLAGDACLPMPPSIIQATLGAPAFSQIEPVPQAANILRSRSTVSICADLLLSGTETGYICEGGATGRGIGLYCLNGRVIFECGNGGNNQTGPTGLNKNLRGYIEWQSPVRSPCRYRVEVSASTIGTTDYARMWVNGEVVAEDTAWAQGNSSGLSGSNGGGILRFNTNWRANQIVTTGGTTAAPIFPQANIRNLKIWTGAMPA